MELPLPKSVFRAILARLAAMCNERIPDSVSPYGGEGELSVGTDPPAIFRVAFTNTAGGQRLDVSRLADHQDGTIDDGASEGDEQSARTKRLELSESELAILGSLMKEMLSGGRDVLLTEYFVGKDVYGNPIDANEYSTSMEKVIGVRLRSLDAVVIRRLMGTVINHWIQLKASLGLIASEDVGLAIHLATAQFANAYPFKDEGSPEREDNED
jgi:hypothetical protein